MECEIRVEPGDLDVNLSFGMIAHGKLKDILLLKERVRELMENELHDLRLVYVTISSRELIILKKRRRER